MVWWARIMPGFGLVGWSFGFAWSVVLLAGEVVTGWGGPVRDLLVIEVHGPAGAVGDAVVVSA